MAAGSGRDFGVYVGDGGSPEGFTQVASFRTDEMTLNGQSVDISDKSLAWEQLLSGGGIKSMTMTGSGIFTDTANEETIRSQWFAQTINNYRYLRSDGAIFAGAFQVESLTYSGEHNGAGQFSATWRSSGAVSFTP